MSDRRSASPRPRSTDRAEPTRKKQKTSGFKWKEKAPRSINDDDNSNNVGRGAGDRDSGRLDRGYRDRSSRWDNFRDREPRDYYGRDKEERRGGAEDEKRDRDRRDAGNGEGRGDASAAPKDKGKEKTKKSKKPKVVAPSEPMIIVSINDRLGTKAQIPCLASDSIKAFKAVVAAHIGRQPHEIMLKRQGERPFKDQLTLEDYGVSNGVQLDLEIDTGD